MPFKTCLIVDDEQAVRRYLRAILEQRGFRAVEADGGIRGLSLVKELGNGLDLIVSDVRMPDGDGLAFASAVRESFPELPIVLVSGYIGAERQPEPSASFEFVQKPFTQAALMTAIDSVMSTSIPT